jgi:F0F1-type ATP synthase assembly protein I
VTRYACLPPSSHTSRAMSPPSKPPVNRGIVAGSLLVAPMIVCALIGYGVGSVVGAVALLTILGVFIGLGCGFALVISRFRDL